MKYLKIYLTLFLLYNFLNTNAQYQTPHTIFAAFKIKRIEREKEHYIIYASNNDTLYKIISQKTFKIKAKKIKRDEVYYLHLVSIFKDGHDLPEIRGIELSPGFVVDRLPESKQLYYCKDITGLYLTPLSHVYYNSQYLIDYPHVSGDFKIKNIHLKNSVYIIELIKDSVNYWIASPKTDCSGNKLKIDSIYFMQIFPYFDESNDFTRIINGAVEVRPRTLIKPNPITGQLYFSYNIYSNCYIKP